jgi:hypothetical protein
LGLLSKMKKTKRGPGAEATCRVVLPLRDHLWIDMDDLMKKYRTLWKDTLPFKESPVPGDLDQRTRRFIIGDVKDGINLSVVDYPLATTFADLLADAPKICAVQTMKFEESDRKSLLEHKAHVMIETRINADNAPLPAYIAAMITLCLTRFYDVTGFAPESAQMYRTKDWANSMIKADEFDAASLFVMLCNYHHVGNGERWLHTHGMEQVGLPDIEAYFDDASRSSELTEMIADLAIYMIDKGPVLEIGHTTQSKGENAIYRVVEARNDPQHPFGRFGALGLKKER